ncbi:MAG TPA: hypothetical protein ENK18_14305 [Deltaproteobacteria bacterium]|nr:hypothetical protein [Deltaproteobacteria bacterium]
MSPRVLCALALQVTILGCASYDAMEGQVTESAPASPMVLHELEDVAIEEELRGERDKRDDVDRMESAQPRAHKPRSRGYRSQPSSTPDADVPPEEPGSIDGGGRFQNQSGEGERGGARTRSWFPEAFLWQPLVETGEDGTTTIDVLVPDQLTTWRILALAHDRQGQQAGALHTFDSRLPIYVDPVVPGWLYTGDQIRLPVSAVNGTSDPVDVSLSVTATGAVTGAGEASMHLTSGSSDVRTIPLVVEGAGSATIRAELRAAAGSDAAVRTVPVLPSGRPVERIRGSTLASTRTFRLPAPGGADASTDLLSVIVFPGPLAVLGAELERLSGGARPSDGAYGFALAAQTRTLAAHAGIEIDEDALRRLQIVSWQRIVRDARAPDAGLAADLLTALSNVPAPPEPGSHALVEGLRPRLVQTVLSGQRADGTWSRAATSTLQRVLIDTATAARALPTDRSGPRLRAMGAVERYIREVDDGYTAAVILASGLASGATAERLQTLVEAALTERPGGGYTVSMPTRAHNAWGVRPGRAEVLAWTVLALPADHEARGDLVSELMGGWSAGRGFGAGRADGIALAAIVAGLPGTPQQIDLSLMIDGAVSATARLDPAQPRVPALLEAPMAGADAEITLQAEPEVPGLAFVATRRSWVPWSDTDRVPGVDVRITPRGLALGRTGTLELSIAAPSGAKLVLEQGLPAGLVLEPSAETVAASAGVELATFSDRIVLTTRPFQAGEILDLALPVSPAFAGRFTTPPLEISVDGGPSTALAPAIWTVAEG